MRLPELLRRSEPRAATGPALLSREEILPANQIPLETLQRREVELKMALQLARDITNEGNFGALAFTQLPKEFLKLFHISPELRNIIYFPDWRPQFADTLIINPEISAQQSREDVNVYTVEGCGSLPRWKKILRRPEEITIWGEAYSERKRLHKLAPQQICGALAADFEHEYHHLQGGTALDLPENAFVDPWKNEAEWERKVSFLSGRQPTLYEVVMQSPEPEWLVLREGMFNVLNRNGEVLRKYEPHMPRVALR